MSKSRNRVDIVIPVTREKSNIFKFYMNDIVRAFVKLVEELKPKVICLDINGNEIASGYITKINIDSKYILLSFSAPCEILKLVFERGDGK